MPALWRVRYAVTENTLAPGRISDDELRQAIEVRGRGWVAECDGLVQGFAIGFRDNGQVWALFVAPEAQGMGLGSRLHQCMLHWFATLPVPMLWLTTGEHTRARAFYERHGWRAVGKTDTGEVRYERANPA